MDSRAVDAPRGESQGIRRAWNDYFFCYATCHSRLIRKRHMAPREKESAANDSTCFDFGVRESFGPFCVEERIVCSEEKGLAGQVPLSSSSPHHVRSMKIFVYCPLFVFVWQQNSSSGFWNPGHRFSRRIWSMDEQSKARK